MLGVAAISWAIRKTCNRSCFEKKYIKKAIEIMYIVCSFIGYWTGLYPENTQKAIRVGVNLMMRTALKLLGRQGGAAASTLLIKDKTEDGEDGQEDD
jgi:hypothetical protein